VVDPKRKVIDRQRAGIVRQEILVVLIASEASLTELLTSSPVGSVT
jgi:hypothetical protein